MSRICGLLALTVLAVGTILSGLACKASAGGPRRTDEWTVVGPGHYWHDIEASRAPGQANVVVEIPTGTTAKWEVEKDAGSIAWEMKEGAPRIVRYLGYPGNYGMIPRTLLSEELGGDGDPLDVLVLGPPARRGGVLDARVIGVLELLDDGEQDDKLIAVVDRTAFVDVADLPELMERFPGVTTIVETWFVNYKGPGRMEARGWGDAARAREILEAAQRAYRARYPEQ